MAELEANFWQLVEWSLREMEAQSGRHWKWRLRKWEANISRPELVEAEGDGGPDLETINWGAELRRRSGSRG